MEHWQIRERICGQNEPNMTSLEARVVYLRKKLIQVGAEPPVIMAFAGRSIGSFVELLFNNDQKAVAIFYLYSETYSFIPKATHAKGMLCEKLNVFSESTWRLSCLRRSKFLP
jgi:hypothetical protein